MLEQFPDVTAAVAAESCTTEQVCKILSTVWDKNKMEDWTAVCWSNKNVFTLCHGLISEPDNNKNIEQPEKVPDGH